VDYPITLPEDHPEADLRNKTATLRVTVKSIKRRKLPELDAAFAKTMDLDSVEELKEDLRKQILRAKEKEARRDMAQAVLERIENDNPIPLPEGLVTANEKENLDKLRTRMLMDGMDAAAVDAELAKHQKESRPAVERAPAGQVRPGARRRPGEDLRHRGRESRSGSSRWRAARATTRRRCGRSSRARA